MDNIQVLERALTLLELVGERPREAHPLHELAAASGLKTPTASRILRTLTNLGYLEQSGRKQGYTLGRKAYELTENPDYSPALLEAALPAMNHFAKQTGEYICLSVLEGDSRVILHNILSNRSIQVMTDSFPRRESPYRSVSGRVLLAHLAPARREAFLLRNNLPGDDWKEIRSEAQLKEALNRIAVQEMLIEIGEEIAALAVPVYRAGRVIAAVGSFIPVYRFENSHRRMIEDLLSILPREIAERMQEK